MLKTIRIAIARWRLERANVRLALAEVEADHALYGQPWGRLSAALRAEMEARKARDIARIKLGQLTAPKGWRYEARGNTYFVK